MSNHQFPDSKNNSKIRSMAIFQDNLGKSIPECHHSGLHWSKDDCGGSDNWNYKTCKVPVKSSPRTNQHPFFYRFFYRLDAFPVTQQLLQCTEGESITFHGLPHPKLTWVSSNLVLTTKGSWLPRGIALWHQNRKFPDSDVQFIELNAIRYCRKWPTLILHC